MSVTLHERPTVHVSNDEHNPLTVHVNNFGHLVMKQDSDVVFVAKEDVKEFLDALGVLVEDAE